jgi:outer membrane murein-binding lipoprotein Lpp
MTAATTAPALITAALPVDPRWSRLPGIEADGRTVTISPADYFFRFESCSWLVADWQAVRDELLPVTETAQEAIEQATLEFIRANARITTDPAEVLSIAWQVYSWLFRDELLPVAGLEQVGPAELRMLREAATFMALNKVRDDGSIANVGPCWFFPAATGVVFGLDDEKGGMLDEVYHGTWFNETRRIESVKAHAALGGRLVHGCQSVPNQSGGAVVPYGASIDRFRQDLDAFRSDWLAAVRSCQPG